MPRPPPVSSRTRWQGLLAGFLVLCAAFSLPAWALRPVRVYEVDLAEQQSATAVQNAMREALVRATGRRESADDPVFASLINDAARYVQSYVSGPRGEPQVVFDAAAVGHAIEAAGRSVWSRQRPFTLVVLYPPPGRSETEAARAELERTATTRGLPISVIPLAVVDGAGNALGGDALLQSAQRYGGDQVLVGRSDAPVAAGQLQWTLYTRGASQTWTGALGEGIDHTVDLLAPPPGTAAAAEGPTRVRVEGVTGLTEYADVERLLQGIPGVLRAEVTDVDSGAATFEVELPGGAAALERALASTSRMVRTASGSPGLIYRYQPPG
jgi:uncharacterized protein